MTAPIDLTGLVVAVTGAGGGIGSGVAARLAGYGASVLAHTRRSPVEARPGMQVVRADLTSPDGASAVVGAAVEHWGRLDAVVNAAGIQPVGALTELSDDEWEEMIAVNLTAARRLTIQAARAMSDGGSIVHVASIEGHQPAPMHGHYSTSKAALLMFARAAAAELGSAGVRVNTVSPGLIERPGLSEDWPEGVARWMSAAPLGRLGTPGDVADACAFLISDMASWITGADLVVDGGVLARPTW